MELPLNTPINPKMPVVVAQSPTNKHTLSSPSVNNENLAPPSDAVESSTEVPISIFTKQEKNNAFGDKIFERTSIICKDVITSQQITNNILELSEQEIVGLLVDQSKFDSMVLEHKKKIELEQQYTNKQCCNSSQKQPSPIFENEKCSICLDVLGEKNRSVTPCGHHFCFSCLYQAMDKQNNCPLCRAKLIENKKKKMRKLSDEAMSDIITETMSDFNLRRHIRSAELFSNNRNNMDSDDIICSSVQIYSLQLANNIQRQQLTKDYYYDDDEDSDSDDEYEDDEEEEEEEEE